MPRDFRFSSKTRTVLRRKIRQGTDLLHTKCLGSTVGSTFIQRDVYERGNGVNDVTAQVHSTPFHLPYIPR